MTRSELIDMIISSAGLNKAEAAMALDAALNCIVSGLRKDQKVTISGFGSFSVTKRKARKARNPRTGQEIEVAASKTPKFTPSKSLKEDIKS